MRALVRFVGVVFVLAACSRTSVEGKATGHVESTGTTGAWVLADAVCFSGERDGFFGVSVESIVPRGPALVIAKDPVAGWVLKARIAGSCDGDGTGKRETCTSMVYKRADCKNLDVNLTLDPTRKTQFFDGTAKFDCEAEGSHVVGAIKVEACRNPFN